LPERQRHGGGIMADGPIISIDHLEKRFSGKNADVFALRGIDLAIGRGDIFGIIGKSGAGKSTLVRCINMLERPTAGSVFFEGRDLCRLPEAALRKARRSMGMIFQQFNLLMQRTALQNVCFPLELTGAPRDETRKRAEELLDMVGLANRMDSYPSQLSGGQKQRVAIARALATKPRVLLCDEATSALDPATTDSILALIKDINVQLGITAVVITHEMSVIEKICMWPSSARASLSSRVWWRTSFSTPGPRRPAAWSCPRPSASCRSPICTGSSSTAALPLSPSSPTWCWNAAVR